MIDKIACKKHLAQILTVFVSKSIKSQIEGKTTTKKHVELIAFSIYWEILW